MSVYRNHMWRVCCLCDRCHRLGKGHHQQLRLLSARRLCIRFGYFKYMYDVCMVCMTLSCRRHVPRSWLRHFERHHGQIYNHVPSQPDEVVTTANRVQQTQVGALPLRCCGDCEWLWSTWDTASSYNPSRTNLYTCVQQ